MLNIAREMNLAERPSWFDNTMATICVGSLRQSKSISVVTRRSPARTCCGKTEIFKLDAQARFHTKSGLLTADRRDGLIELDFPATPPAAAPAPEGLAAALGAKPKFVGSQPVRLPRRDRERIDRARAHAGLNAISQIQARGVIVTSKADSNKCLRLRVSLLAQPVGRSRRSGDRSAHCALAPYWSAKLAKQELRAYQASRAAVS